MTTAFYNSPFQKMNMTHEADIVPSCMISLNYMKQIFFSMMTHTFIKHSQDDKGTK